MVSITMQAVPDGTKRDDLCGVCVIVHMDPYRPKWWAALRWQDGKFCEDGCEDGCVEGEIRTRYPESSLAEALDRIIEVARTFRLPLWDRFGLFYRGDGGDPRFLAPADYRERLRAEAERRGWRTYGMPLFGDAE